MCNAYKLQTPVSALFDDFSQIIPTLWADGQASNLEARDDIRITDLAPVVRRVGNQALMSMTRWSWKGLHGKPVFNFVTEGRDFARSDRVLVPADGFYEFTKPADPGQRLKDKWCFALSGEPWFWIAGVVRDGAFALLTTQPGPDVAPYHDRQVVVLPRAQGLNWLDLCVPAADLFAPSPAGSLTVIKAR
jgi:putative SOS response-associated peptidase YedK